jgi:hypothetical protein
VNANAARQTVRFIDFTGCIVSELVFKDDYFPFDIESAVDCAESKKSVIFAIYRNREQSALAEKGKAHLNSPASYVFAEKSF